MKAFLFTLALMAAAPVQAAVELLAGSSPQSMIVGQKFQPIRVRVTDEQGRPAAGVRATQAIASRTPLMFAHGPEPGSGICVIDLGIYCTVVTNAEGEASFPSLYASAAGTHPALIGASGPGGASLGHATAELIARESLAPTQLRVVSGDGQRVMQGAALRPLSVQVLDASGRPVPRASVELYRGFGPWLEETHGLGSSLTDDQGRAEFAGFVAGREVGAGRVSIVATLPGYHVPQARVLFDYVVTTPSGATTIDYQGMWWAGLEQSGWGISLSQEGDDLFPVVFAYDEQGQPTWYVVLNLYGDTPWYFYNFGNGAYSPRSAPFHEYDPSRFTLGRGTGYFHFQFASPGAARFQVDLPGKDRAVWQLSRQDFSGDTLAPLQVASGMWWGGPSQNGWGVSIMQQPGGMFIVWMTYGEDGKPTWFVMPSGSWNGTIYEGPILRTSGARWPEFDTRLLQFEAVGSFSFDFEDATHATFRWSVGARAGTERIVKQPL